MPRPHAVSRGSYGGVGTAATPGDRRMETVDLPDIDLMSRLDAEFRATSGLTDRRFYKIFYSAIAPAPLLVLGFNPGGEIGRH